MNGRVLEVKLPSGKARVIELDEELYKSYIGGRGLAAYILWRELGSTWESIDPLSPENPLIVLTGPLTGYYPGARVCISAKSPQSHGVVGSTIASEVGVELKAAGFDGVVIRGASRDPVYIYIYNDNVEVRDASRIWGSTGTEFLDWVSREFRSECLKNGFTTPPAALYIGPAGENLVRTATVMSKLTHAAGYGGYGAVMGSKMVKAILVKGTKPLPKPHDKARLSTCMKELLKTLTSRQHFRLWGTLDGLWRTGHDHSSMPVRNWVEEWHDNKGFTHLEAEFKLWVKRFWSDWGCPTACMKVSVVRRGGGRFVTDNPDYELAAYLGSNLGVFSVEDAAYLSALADELGLCGIQTGNVIGFAIELFEKRVISEEDVGYKLSWGDVEAIAKLMKDIAYRRGFGEILAEGVYRAALRISREKGVDALKHAVQVKGIGVGAHGVRSGLDYPKEYSYAVSVQGGDHTSTAALPIDSVESEAWSILLDSAVICLFNAVNEELVFKTLNAVTGWSLTREEYYGEIALRILALQRILLLLGGPDVYWDPRVSDDNPPRFYEPLPTGPCAGRKLDKNIVAEKVREYYEAVGWDENGIPKPEVLEKLGLKEACREIERIKLRLGLK